jgi:hypothetical protein
LQRLLVARSTLGSDGRVLNYAEKEASRPPVYTYEQRYIEAFEIQEEGVTQRSRVRARGARVDTAL